MAMPDAMEFVGKDGDYDYGDVHPNPNAQQHQDQQQQGRYSVMLSFYLSARLCVSTRDGAGSCKSSDHIFVP